jgi:hypothetical protein
MPGDVLVVGRVKVAVSIDPDMEMSIDDSAAAAGTAAASKVKVPVTVSPSTEASEENAYSIGAARLNVGAVTHAAATTAATKPVERALVMVVPSCWFTICTCKKHAYRSFPTASVGYGFQKARTMLKV